MLTLNVLSASGVCDVLLETEYAARTIRNR
jgi:hypothetical protein